MGEEVVCDGEAVGEAIGEALRVGVAGDVVVIGVADGVTEVLDEGVGVTVTATPLFQTNFFPDLMQVYFLPL